MVETLRYFFGPRDSIEVWTLFALTFVKSRETKGQWNRSNLIIILKNHLFQKLVSSKVDFCNYLKIKSQNIKKVTWDDRAEQQLVSSVDGSSFDCSDFNWDFDWEIFKTFLTFERQFSRDNLKFDPFHCSRQILLKHFQWLNFTLNFHKISIFCLFWLVMNVRTIMSIPIMSIPKNQNQNKSLHVHRPKNVRP